jgi:hypothetical protein
MDKIRAAGPLQIGPYGFRLTFALAERRIMAEFPMSPAEHRRAALDHLRAAEELERAGAGPHERPDGIY